MQRLWRLPIIRTALVALVGGLFVVAAVSGCATARDHVSAAHRAAPPHDPAGHRGGPHLDRVAARQNVRSAAPSRAAAAPAYFRTLPPGAKLPSGAQCARWVRARPDAENKGMNRRFNHARGKHVGRRFFAGDKPAADRLLAPRINGYFTGTTEEILRWAACKWGIDQNVVFAQAAVESWWQQTTKGDWETNGCPPGHPPGADGKPGLCPQSWGILQNRYPYEKPSWPAIARSTAMNADTAYAIWRSCFDGYDTWLNTVPHAGRYHAGDAWGCVGTWFAGRWLTAPARRYISQVKRYMREHIWTKPDFQQPG